MKVLYYPTVEQIIEFNHLALAMVKTTKADQAKVLRLSSLVEIIGACHKEEGDVFDKAVILLIGLVRKHPFASGNRRTAFLVMKDFLWHNKSYCGIKDDVRDARVLLGIREGFYSPTEIKEWIKHGKIRSFER